MKVLGDPWIWDVVTYNYLLLHSFEEVDGNLSGVQVFPL